MKSLNNGVLAFSLAALVASLVTGCPPPPKAVEPAYADEITEIESGGTGSTTGARTLIADAGTITSFAVSAEAVYFTTSKTVSRYDKQDGKITVVADGEHSPMCLATDEQNIFWCEHAAGVIKMFDTLQEGGVQAVAEGLQRPRGLVVNGDVVWVAENVNAGTIVGVPLKGGERVVLASGQKLPVVAAASRTHVYWMNQVRGSSSIMAVAKSGGEPVVLAKDQPMPRFMTIDDDNAYWTARESIYSVPLGGGKVVTVADGQAGPSGLVANLDGLAWANGDGGSVWSLPKGEKAPKPIAQYEGLPKVLKAHGDSLYWIDESPPSLRTIKYP